MNHNGTFIIRLDFIHIYPRSFAPYYIIYYLLHPKAFISFPTHTLGYFSEIHARCEYVPMYLT